MSMTDEELLQGISQDCEIHFDMFMSRHSAHLFFYAYGIVGNKESAEEVVSDVFMEVWKMRRKLSDIDNILSWMNTVAYHKSVSYLRKESRFKHNVSFDSLANFQFPTIKSPSEDLISKEELSRLNSLIESLPAKCKHVFYLAKIEKIPYAEIAKSLEISLATVNYHVGYAMNYLKKMLNPALFAILTYMFS